MSVDHVDETTGEAAREAAGEAVRVQAATALRYYAVAPGVRLNVRSGPGTGYPIVKVLPEGIKVPVYCQTPGTWVSGYYGTTNIWDNIGNGEFVSDSYVQTGSDGYIAPRCA